MNHSSSHVTFLLAILMIISGCGGVVGSIKKYNYNISPQKLKLAVENLYNEHPEWIPPNDSAKRTFGKYYLPEHKEYLLYLTDDKKYLLNFAVLHENDSIQKESTLALLRGAEYGKILYLESNLTKKEKSNYIKLFQKVFIRELNVKLEKEKLK